MKPPLTEFRLGELFGNGTKNLQGFVKSLNFSYPDSSPWEHIKGKRVPKFVEVNIDYQVIHDKTPGMFIETEGNDYKSTHITGMHGYAHDTSVAGPAPLDTIKLG